VTREFARQLDLRLVGTAYVPLGTDDFRGVVERIRASDAQAVLLYLVGQDAVQFNRVFAEEGLQDRLVRFTPLMEENVLLASGAEATRNLFVCASYFRSLATPSALEFCGDYVDQHGFDAPPLNNAAESCCEGLMALAALARAPAASTSTGWSPSPTGSATTGCAARCPSPATTSGSGSTSPWPTATTSTSSPRSSGTTCALLLTVLFTGISCT
jgi:ABC-type branched-subunit amino acid transport system substrate-binding protein